MRVFDIVKDLSFTSVCALNIFSEWHNNDNNGRGRRQQRNMNNVDVFFAVDSIFGLFLSNTLSLSLCLKMSKY